MATQLDAEHDAETSGVAGANPAVAATRTAGHVAGCSFYYGQFFQI
jgi:hypothetical protein